MPKKITKTFDEKCHRIEEIIDKLESSPVDLEQSLKIFSEGIKIAKNLEQELAQAESQVTKLIEADGKLTESPFTS